MKLRELDAFIAENLEGLPVVWAPDPYRLPDRRLTDIHPWIHGEFGGIRYEWEPVARYSTEWKALERVISQMIESGWHFIVRSRSVENDEIGAEAVFMAIFVSIESYSVPPDDARFSEGNTLQLALSRAAVAALKNVEQQM
jgi:hypothetical protein